MTDQPQSTLLELLRNNSSREVILNSLDLSGVERLVGVALDKMPRKIEDLLTDIATTPRPVVAFDEVLHVSEMARMVIDLRNARKREREDTEITALAEEVATRKVDELLREAVVVEIERQIDFGDLARIVRPVNPGITATEQRIADTESRYRHDQ